MNMKIVVLQRGWVVVGDVSRVGTHIRIENCAVIRRWGTTKGLGELAMSGPTSETILDRCPPVNCHELTVVMEMDITSRREKWTHI